MGFVDGSKGKCSQRLGFFFLENQKKQRLPCFVFEMEVMVLRNCGGVVGLWRCGGVKEA